MRLSRLLKVLAATSVILIFVFLVYKARAVDGDQHNRYSAAIRELKETDATLNQDVLRTRYGLLESYDAIEVELAEMKRLQGILRGIPVYLDSEGRAEMGRSLEEIGKDFEDKERLIQKFKSQNAVVSNSLRYFPIAAKQFIEQAAFKPGSIQLNAALNSLLEDVLLYSQAPNNELVDKISGQMARLSEMIARQQQAGTDAA